jgi:hypothetical protein
LLSRSVFSRGLFFFWDKGQVPPGGKQKSLITKIIVDKNLDFVYYLFVAEVDGFSLDGN